MDRRLLGVLAVVLIGFLFFAFQRPEGEVAVYKPQSMYVYMLVDPSRIDEYQCIVAWHSPDPVAVRGPYVDFNHGIVVYQFDLPYAPDINEVSVVYPSGEVGRLIFEPTKRVPYAVVVVDISPTDRSYVFVCADAVVYEGLDGIARYAGLCSGPFTITPGSVVDLNGLEVFPERGHT